ncbi:acyclic terpene utilization AtuA family protein, partial [Burkholderia gladioli]
MTASASASTSAPPAPAGRRVRLGAGAGYSGDRIEPAVELAEHGALDYLVFECLA